jgi:hypothetical protein
VDLRQSDEFDFRRQRRDDAFAVLRNARWIVLAAIKLA